MCDRSFTERKMLSPNMKSHKGDNSFECSQSDTPVANSGHEDQCETEHGKPESKKTHEGQTKKGEKQTSLFKQSRTRKSKEKIYCKLCNKIFANMNTFRAHRAKHAGKRYYCSICPESFTTLAATKQHEASHHRERPWHCSQCEATFIRKAHLYRHEKVHQGKKEHTCEVCGKCFVLRQSLMSHMKSHDDVKRYSCPVCNNSYKTKSVLKMHLKIHSDQRDFTCGICKRGFVQKKTYLDHMRVHENNLIKKKALFQPQKHFCSLCGKGFANDVGLRRHKRKHELGILRSFKSSVSVSKLRVLQTENNLEAQNAETSDLAETERALGNNKVNSTRTALETNAVQPVLDAETIDWNKCYLRIDDNNLPLPDDETKPVKEETVSTVSEKGRNGIKLSADECEEGCTDSNGCIPIVNDIYVADDTVDEVEERNCSKDPAQSDSHTKGIVEIEVKAANDRISNVLQNTDMTTDASVMHNEKVIEETSVELGNKYKAQAGEQDLDVFQSAECIEKSVIQCKMCEFQSCEKIQFLLHWRKAHYKCGTRGRKTEVVKQEKKVLNASNSSEENEENIRNGSKDDLPVVSKRKGQKDEGRNSICRRKKNLPVAPATKPVCEKCGRTFTSLSTLRNHRMLDKCVEGYECEKCHYCFGTKFKLMEHTKTVHDDFPYKCSLCPKAFATSSGLTKHKKKHKNGSAELTVNRDFMCGTCGKCYSTNHGLKTHMSAHSNIKPFQCQHCEMSFSQKSHMVRHVRVCHENIRDLICTVQGCNKRFPDQYRLRDHLRCHTGEKPFWCEKCNSSFSTSAILKSHVKSQHLKLRNFTCQICFQDFTAKHSLDKHMERHTAWEKMDVNSPSYVPGFIAKVRTVKKMEPKVFPCDKCERRFTTKRGLASHQKRRCRVEASA